MQQPDTYGEKATGARPDRRELNRMLGKLAPGNVVTVTKIDRLARSTFDLLGIVERILDAKAQFRSLAEPRVHTGTSTGRLMAVGSCACLGPWSGSCLRQQKEAARRRAQGAALRELADSYDRSITTMRRVTRARDFDSRSGTRKDTRCNKTGPTHDTHLRRRQFRLVRCHRARPSCAIGP